MFGDSSASLPSVNQIPSYKIEFISTPAFELEDILTSLKTGKAAGPDFIDNRLLKELARPVSAPFTDLFFFSFKMQSSKSLKTSLSYSRFQKE